MPLHRLDASSLLSALERGETTSEQVVRHLLDRMAQIDGPNTPVSLRSIIAVSPTAIADAVACDAERAAGALRGPLHGLPVVIKDNIEAIGLPGTAGSLALRDAPVAGDAPVVQRLRAAGAVILAATNLSEWANIRSSASTSGWSAVGGLVANPWALDRSAGGSSSGSGAAVAAGLTPLALGTETDGSIVCPSALNGVVGLKPTVGTLPVEGIAPISHSQDTPGPMARTVADVRLLWEALTGAAVAPVDVAGLRLARVRAWDTGFAHTDGLLTEVLAQAQTLVREVVEVDVPRMTSAEHEDELTVLLAELHDDMATYLSRRQPPSGVRTLADVVDFNRAHADVELALFGQELFESAVERGGESATTEQARARNVAWARTTCLDPAFAQADVLVAPTYAPAWKHDFVLGHPDAGGAVTSPAAIAGYPLLSLPMGQVHGLPVGMALVGRPGAESVLLALAAALEEQLALDADGAWWPAFHPESRG